MRACPYGLTRCPGFPSPRRPVLVIPPKKAGRRAPTQPRPDLTPDLAVFVLVCFHRSNCGFASVERGWAMGDGQAQKKRPERQRSMPGSVVARRCVVSVLATVLLDFRVDFQRCALCRRPCPIPSRGGPGRGEAGGAIRGHGRVEDAPTAVACSTVFREAGEKPGAPSDGPVRVRPGLSLRLHFSRSRSNPHPGWAL